MKKRPVWIMIGGIALVVALVVGSRLAIGASLPSGPAWLTNDIQEYSQTLTANPNPTQAALLSQKLNLLEQANPNQIKGVEGESAKAANPCDLMPTARPQVQSDRVEGILEGLLAPINPSSFSGTNQWQGYVNDQWTVVYAGADGQNLQQGLLWVDVESTGEFDSYPAAQPGGALTILSAENNVLLLSDESGDTLYFDMAARSYLSVPDQSLPTLEPQPTLTPTPSICG